MALVLLLVIAGFGYQELQKEAERQAKSQTEEQVQRRNRQKNRHRQKNRPEQRNFQKRPEKRKCLTGGRKRIHRIYRSAGFYSVGSGWKADQPERNPGRKAGGDQFLDQQMPALQRGNAGLGRGVSGNEGPGTVYHGRQRRLHGRDRESGRAYVEEQGFTFPVYYDLEMDAVINYGIQVFPTTYILNGKVAW